MKCDHCSSDAHILCPECNFGRYCGEECRVIDFEDHQPICEQMKQHTVEIGGFFNRKKQTTNTIVDFLERNKKSDIDFFAWFEIYRYRKMMQEREKKYSRDTKIEPYGDNVSSYFAAERKVNFLDLGFHLAVVITEHLDLLADSKVLDGVKIQRFGTQVPRRIVQDKIDELGRRIALCAKHLEKKYNTDLTNIHSHAAEYIFDLFNKAVIEEKDVSMKDYCYSNMRLMSERIKALTNIEASSFPLFSDITGRLMLKGINVHEMAVFQRLDEKVVGNKRIIRPTVSKRIYAYLFYGSVYYCLYATVSLLEDLENKNKNAYKTFMTNLSMMMDYLYDKQFERYIETE